LPIAAPAFANSASGIRDKIPAPLSTTTSKPSPESRFTVSGDAATRGSSAAVSLGMKTVCPTADPLSVGRKKVAFEGRATGR
jgi:hypothetical protein